MKQLITYEQALQRALAADRKEAQKRMQERQRQSMSDTPRTDAQTGWVATVGVIKSSDLMIDPDGQLVHAQFARELERELAAANARIKRLEEAGDGLFKIAEKVFHSGGEDMYWIRLLEDELSEWKQAKEAKP